MAEEKKEEKTPAGVEPREDALASNSEPQVLIRFAESFRLQGRYEEAIETCRQGLEKMPDFLSGHMLLGRCYFEKGLFAEAREELEKVVKEIEEYLPAYKWLGQIYFQGKEIDKALEAMRKGLFLTTAGGTAKKEITPLEIDFLTRGKPPFINPKFDPAKNLSENHEESKENEASPKSIQTDTLAEIYLKQGHLEKALAVYQEILEREPGNLPVRKKLTEVKVKMQVDSKKKSRQKIINHLEQWLSRMSSRST